MMTSKKKLKKRNKRLKKEHKQLWRDYKDLGDDYSSYVLLYHDVIGLFAKFDPELLLEVVKTTLRDCDEAMLSTRIEAAESGDAIYVQLQEEKRQRKYAEWDAKMWGEFILKQGIKIEKLEEKIAKLKAPKAWVNGEEMVFTGRT